MSTDKSIAVLGLPESGKTTFLAALWYFLDNHSIPEALKLEKLEGDWSHLNEIRRLWVDVKPLERTFPNKENTVSMCIKTGVKGSVSRISMPDLSGERVRD